MTMDSESSFNVPSRGYYADKLPYMIAEWWMYVLANDKLRLKACESQIDHHIKYAPYLVESLQDEWIEMLRIKAEYQLGIKTPQEGVRAILDTIRVVGYIGLVEL